MGCCGTREPPPSLLEAVVNRADVASMSVPLRQLPPQILAPIFYLYAKSPQIFYQQHNTNRILGKDRLRIKRQITSAV